MPRRAVVCIRTGAAEEGLLAVEPEKVVALAGLKMMVAGLEMGAVVDSGKGFRARRLARFARDNRGRIHYIQPHLSGL